MRNNPRNNGQLSTRFHRSQTRRNKLQKILRRSSHARAFLTEVFKCAKDADVCTLEAGDVLTLVYESKSECGPRYSFLLVI
jgi:hypothetical protein